MLGDSKATLFEQPVETGARTADRARDSVRGQAGILPSRLDEPAGAGEVHLSDAPFFILHCGVEAFKIGQREAAEQFHGGRRLRRVHIRAVTGECRSEEHTSELQSLMRITYAVFCLKKKK